MRGMHLCGVSGACPGRARAAPTGLFHEPRFGRKVAAVARLAVPGIAVSIRRLHDTGRSGWSLLIGLVAILGAIVLLVFMAMDSEEQPNQ
jgi:hypothetical protein